MQDDIKLAPLHADWRPTDLPFAAFVRSFVSGDPTGDRIRVQFYKGKEEAMLWGRIWFGPGAEGPPGHVHGGAQAAALDELLGGLAWLSGYKVIALNLQTDFVTFTPLGVELVLRGAILKKEGRKIYTEGTIEDSSGKVFAKGKILFLELADEHVARLVPHLREKK